VQVKGIYAGVRLAQLTGFLIRAARLALCGYRCQGIERLGAARSGGL